jgi:hypothetical protein
MGDFLLIPTNLYISLALWVFARDVLPQTLNPQPYTLHDTPSTLSPQPSTLHAIHPKPYTLNPQPSTLNLNTHLYTL